ncbi:MAG: peroxiredoxin-like family protein [Thermodesulfobacteriota bacterium]
MAPMLKPGDKAEDFRFETPWDISRNFYSATAGKTAVLVFLRYFGCPVCRMEMADLKREIGLFNRKQAEVLVFLQSPPATLAIHANPEDWPFTIVCDPTGELFRLYGVETGGIFKYLHPAGLVAAVKATARGFRHGKFEGRETQLPAVFVVSREKTIAWAHYGKTIGDVPSPLAIANHLG